MNENLWAPWRLKYVEKAGSSGNIFLDLPAQNDDRKNFILVRGETAFVLLNAYPYTSGHLMVAPYRQTNEFHLMSDQELLEINQLLAKSVRWLKEAYNPDGFNVGLNIGSAAGAGIPIHLHWHVVPRWSGDTNFMTTIGEVRVMPATLEESYDKLMEIIRNDP
ncbi:MAG: HIT domain-containing protein [Armatimonadota bacterium]